MDYNMPKVARIGDKFDCGDVVATGSPNVWANNIPITRINDKTTGHDCFRPSTVTQIVTSTVFVNNLPIGILGKTKNVPHSCSHGRPHSGTISKASPNVFAE